MESFDVIKFGIFDDFSQTFDDDITNVISLNYKELLVSTKNDIYIIENNIVKMKYSIKLSECTVIPNTNFLIGVTFKKGELMVYQINGLYQIHKTNNNVSENSLPLLKKFATKQSDIFHILFSEKSQSIITFGSEIKVFNFQYKLSQKPKSKPTITITNRSSFSYNYDPSNMIPPQFDQNTESILLPTDSGICAFNLDGVKVGQLSQNPSTLQTIYSFNPIEKTSASKATSKTKKKVTLKISQNTLTYDINQGMNMWGTNGQLIKQFDTIRSPVLAIFFIDSENSICINSCNILFFLNVKTGKTFYYMNVNKKPSRIFLVSLYNEPVLCAVFGSNLRALSLVIPWRVWQLNIENALTIKRCNKYLSAARILIDTEASFVKFFSPRSGGQISIQNQTNKNHPLFYIYDRGTVENYIFNKKKKIYNVQVLKITRSANESELIRDCLFVIQQNGTIQLFETNIEATQKVVSVNCRASFVRICRAKFDGNYRWCLAVASEKAELFLLDYFTFEELRHFTFSEDSLIQMFFIFENDCIVFVFAEKTVLVDIESGRIIDTISIAGNRLTSLFADFLMFGYDSGHVQQIRIDEKHFVLVSENKKKEAKKSSSKDKNESLMMKPHSCPITGFSFSPRIWVSCGLDGNLIAWNYGLEIIAKISLPLPLRACLIMNGRRDILVATATEIMQIKNDYFMYNVNEVCNENSDSKVEEEEDVFEDPEIKEIDNFDKMKDFVGRVVRKVNVKSTEKVEAVSEKESEAVEAVSEDESKNKSSRKARRVMLMKKKENEDSKAKSDADEGKESDASKQKNKSSKEEISSSDKKKKEASSANEKQKEKDAQKEKKNSSSSSLDSKSPSNAKQKENQAQKASSKSNESKAKDDQNANKGKDDLNANKSKDDQIANKSKNDQSSSKSKDGLNASKSKDDQSANKAKDDLNMNKSKDDLNASKGEDGLNTNKSKDDKNSSKIKNDSGESCSTDKLNENGISQSELASKNGDSIENKESGKGESSEISKLQKSDANEPSISTSEGGLASAQKDSQDGGQGSLCSESSDASSNPSEGAGSNAESGASEVAAGGNDGASSASGDSDAAFGELQLDQSGEDGFAEPGSGDGSAMGEAGTGGENAGDIRALGGGERQVRDECEIDESEANERSKDGGEGRAEGGEEKEGGRGDGTERAAEGCGLGGESAEGAVCIEDEDEASEVQISAENDLSPEEADACIAGQCALAAGGEDEQSLGAAESRDKSSEKQGIDPNEASQIHSSQEEEEEETINSTCLHNPSSPSNISHLSSQNSDDSKSEDESTFASVTINERSPTPPPIRPPLSVPSSPPSSPRGARMPRSRTPSPARGRRGAELAIPPNIIIDKEAVLALYGRGRLEFGPYVEQIQREFMLASGGGRGARHVTLSYVRNITAAIRKGEKEGQFYKEKKMQIFQKKGENGDSKSGYNGFYSPQKMMNVPRKLILPPIGLNRSFSPTAYVYNYDDNNTETFFNTLDIHGGVTTPRRIVSLSARKPILLTQHKRAMIVKPKIDAKRYGVFARRRKSPAYQTGGSPRRKCNINRNDDVNC